MKIIIERYEHSDLCTFFGVLYQKIFQNTVRFEFN